MKKITEHVELQPIPQIFEGFPPMLEVKRCRYSGQCIKPRT